MTHSRFIYYFKLFTALEKLVCFLGDACVPNPCMNNGVCVANGFGGYTCQCSAGYSGALCEDRKYNTMLHFCMVAYSIFIEVILALPNHA